MMKFKWFIFVSFFCISSLHAAENIASGVGAISCGKYMANRSSSSIDTMLSTWQQGFITALNSDSCIKDRTWRPIPDAETLELLSQKFCQMYPMDLVMTVTQRIYNELPTRKNCLG